MQPPPDLASAYDTVLLKSPMLHLQTLANEMLRYPIVYTKVEIASRYEILLDNYIKTIQVEALTAVKWLKHKFIQQLVIFS